MAEQNITLIIMLDGNKIDPLEAEKLRQISGRLMFYCVKDFGTSVIINGKYNIDDLKGIFNGKKIRVQNYIGLRDPKLYLENF